MVGEGGPELGGDIIRTSETDRAAIRTESSTVPQPPQEPKRGIYPIRIVRSFLHLDRNKVRDNNPNDQSQNNPQTEASSA